MICHNQVILIKLILINYENILSKCNNNEIEIIDNIGAGGSAGAGATSHNGYKTNCNDCRTLYKSKTFNT